MLLNLNSNFFF
ncbi:hypothetical protein NC653_019936 [Populus alba x Populus x berolinensis]|uniref:Uncharacterized protein n=1 Tax=Populus alba x Populus x berolinensis TaxID=444605 RepID=A0AAD6MJD0_9ROSI|nr:hypothetical protein NC653_019936 [Populus alba x Populus x berolinensis]